MSLRRVSGQTEALGATSRGGHTSRVLGQDGDHGETTGPPVTGRWVGPGAAADG